MPTSYYAIILVSKN